MAEAEGRTRFVAHTEGAAALASRGIFLDDAEQLARAGFDYVDEMVETSGRQEQPGPPPAPSLMYAALHDTLGWVHFHQERPETAQRELTTAYDLSPTRPDTLLHLGQFHESRGDHERAEQYYLECAALPMFESHPCYQVLEEYYRRREGTDAGFEAYLASVRDRLLDLSFARVADARLAEPSAVPPFTLTSVDGRTVTLSELRGKTVILKFWAEWCGPCRLEMPEFSDFVARHADTDDLEILTISVDANPENARRWMQDNGLNFEILIDANYSKRANVMGIPHTWFIDAGGRKVFEIQGATPDLENEYSARLDSMRQADRAD